MKSKRKLLSIRSLITRSWWFNELQKKPAGISQKVLTGSLGETMRPILDSMAEWGTAYQEGQVG